MNNTATTFNTLITGDVFHFLNEKTLYLVCYDKQHIKGNNIIEEIDNPDHIQSITPSMMDRVVVKIPESELNYV